MALVMMHSEWRYKSKHLKKIMDVDYEACSEKGNKLTDCQKKELAMHLLSIAMEVLVAENATQDERETAQKVLFLVNRNLLLYLQGHIRAKVNILHAAYLCKKLAEKETFSLAHQMSSSLGSLYGLPHGHAQLLCMREILQHLISDTENSDKQSAQLSESCEPLNVLCRCFSLNQRCQIPRQLNFIMKILRLSVPTLREETDVNTLVTAIDYDKPYSVPFVVDRQTVEQLYTRVLDDTDTEVFATDPDSYTRQLQLYALEILIRTDLFCREHNLTYYLGEGTLLGAVRHGGFIPWDDDVDILMPREDYNKFVRLCAEGKLPPELHFDALENNPRHWVLGAKVQITTPTRFNQPKVATLSPYSGPYIDIFPLDYVPEEYSYKQAFQDKQVKVCRRLLFMKTGYSNKMKKKILRVFFQLGSFFITNRFVQKYAIRQMTKYHDSDHKYLVNLCSYYPAKKETFLKDSFGEPRLVPFEGFWLPVPHDYDYILRKIYGKNYAGIPPVDVIGSRKHQFEIKEQFTGETDVCKNLESLKRFCEEA